MAASEKRAFIVQRADWWSENDFSAAQDLQAATAVNQGSARKDFPLVAASLNCNPRLNEPARESPLALSQNPNRRPPGSPDLAVGGREAGCQVRGAAL